MYHPLKQKYTVYNNTDRFTMMSEVDKIDVFLASLDDVNYPYLIDTIKNLEEISEDIFAAVKKYDKKLLQDIRS